MISLRKNDPQPLYLQVKESLRREISAGRFKPNEALPDERSLAAELGLSRMTVRRAMVELTQEGFFERIPGRGTFLRPGKEGNGSRSGGEGLLSIALVSHHERFDASDGKFYFRMLQGMQEASAERASVILKRIGTPLPEFVKSLQADRAIDGMLVLGVVAHEVVDALAASGIPAVFYDCTAPSAAGAYGIVTHASEDGGYQAGTALAEMGHRRFAVFIHASSGDVKSAVIGPIARERLAGFERALHARGLRLAPDAARPVACSSPAGYAAMRDLIQNAKGPLPTALFCTTDEMAIGAISAAKDAGLRVPEDLSIVGFGDVGHFSVPALTTVRAQVERSGEDAARLLLERIADRKLPFRKHVLPTEFIARASSGLPRPE
ncbi:MAG: GntR family transcriptional regulator [Planctomycetes bacterium]|nr:GntR family transcriptional regulator [Planctomycetota bacterium]